MSDDKNYKPSSDTVLFIRWSGFKSSGLLQDKRKDCLVRAKGFSSQAQNAKLLATASLLINSTQDYFWYQSSTVRLMRECNKTINYVIVDKTTKN